MGKDKNEDRKFERRFKGKGASTGGADWCNATPQLLVDTVASVAHKGGALRLGYTRDGGAYAIGVYGDGSPYTVYIKPAEDIDDYLRDIGDAFKSLPIPDNNHT